MINVITSSKMSWLNTHFSQEELLEIYGKSSENLDLDHKTERL